MNSTLARNYVLGIVQLSQLMKLLVLLSQHSHICLLWYLEKENSDQEKLPLFFQFAYLYYAFTKHKQIDCKDQKLLQIQSKLASFSDRLKSSQQEIVLYILISVLRSKALLFLFKIVIQSKMKELPSIHNIQT